MIRSLSIAALVAYLFVLLAVTLAFKHPQYRPVAERLSLTPFQSIGRDIPRGGRGLWLNIVGNIAVFAPLGVAFVALGSGRFRWRHAALAGLALSTAIEVIQFQSGRRFTDVDDVILNTFGTLLGFLAADSLRRLALRRCSGERV
ncbi:VanZ family protein [Planctomyces sp. SH-PL62]|uniref:VanZ family protein n=1 Tax=Planctomyces sp. SH-PL62 TaxID=1636152 RepID=UPI00078D1280|nr:VanZ family protein [Planctomyces sp. SH-PL62]AMV39070.1 VanZ like family protein [Planctomyces sp. SH-PL62]